MWKTQLRAWLYSDEALGHFLPDGRYANWQAEETNAQKIQQLEEPDPEETETMYQERSSQERNYNPRKGVKGNTVGQDILIGKVSPGKEKKDKTPTKTPTKTFTEIK